MKIAISATGTDSSNLLDMRFGRCSYFQIYDMESGQMKCIDNKGQTAGEGAGVVSAQQLIDENIECIITGNAGPNAYKLLKGADVKIYKCGDIKIEAALEDYKEGRLAEATEAGPAHSGSGKGFGTKGGK